MRHFTGEDVWAWENGSRAIGSEGSVLLWSSAATLKAEYKNRLYRLSTVSLSPAPSWRWRLRGDRTRRSARPPAGTAERWDTASQNLPPVPTPDLGWTHPHLRRHKNPGAPVIGTGQTSAAPTFSWNTGSIPDRHGDWWKFGKTQQQMVEKPKNSFATGWHEITEDNWS